MNKTNYYCRHCNTVGPMNEAYDEPLGLSCESCHHSCEHMLVLDEVCYECGSDIEPEGVDDEMARRLR